MRSLNYLLRFYTLEYRNLFVYFTIKEIFPMLKINYSLIKMYNFVPVILLSFMFKISCCIIFFRNYL